MTVSPPSATARLRDLLRANHGGAAVGVPSVCSAEPFVLSAALGQALVDNRIALIESTCNQVNQEGGYTGMTPADFARQVRDLADTAGLPAERLVLGGDHLGPYPWRSQSADAAMARARELVRACVQAGYTKVHLDPSMPLGGDGPVLDETTALSRTVELCATAEDARAGLPPDAAPPLYVIGTEVPRPGGEQAGDEGPRPTRPDDARAFLTRARQAFAASRLDDAWRRVVAVVVQPGVEFGTWTAHQYDASRAAGLAAVLAQAPGLVYEAHSTDYQPEDALRALVRDHFAVLKVGPALTFAFREALFALEEIETRLLGGAADTSRVRAGASGVRAGASGAGVGAAGASGVAEGAAGVEPSRLRETLDAAMVADPTYWRDYYRGGEDEVRRARLFSLSDRCRYYWPRPDVRSAIDRLLHNLSAAPVPLDLLDEHLPRQAEAVRAGECPPSPEALVRHTIGTVLKGYWRACGG